MNKVQKILLTKRKMIKLHHCDDIIICMSKAKENHKIKIDIMTMMIITLQDQGLVSEQQIASLQKVF